MPFPPYHVETPPRAYAREQVLGYLELCRGKCLRVVSDLTEERSRSASPFPWVALPIGELLVYNLRHVQHHVGQLNLLLQWTAGISASWVGTAGGSPMDEGTGRA